MAAFARQLDGLYLARFAHIRMGLPVSSRLRSSGDFASVRSKGTAFPGRFVVLSVLKLDDPGAPTLFGFITSKKVGIAVQRNRFRRQLREIARHHPLQKGHWVVTIVRWRAAQATFEELKHDWLKAAKRARLLPKFPSPSTPPPASVGSTATPPS